MLDLPILGTLVFMKRQFMSNLNEAALSGFDVFWGSSNKSGLKIEQLES